MNKQKGISQIVVMIIMLVLAIALPLTTSLVKKSQENRSKAASMNCAFVNNNGIIGGTLSTGDKKDGELYKGDITKLLMTYDGTGKSYTCTESGWVVSASTSNTINCSVFGVASVCGQFPSTCDWTESGCVEKTINSNPTFTSCDFGSKADQRNDGSVEFGGTKTGKYVWNSVIPFWLDESGSESKTYTCTSSGWVFSNSTPPGTGAGTGTGAEACVAKSGACQTSANGTRPGVGTDCTVNNSDGTYQYNLCSGQYDAAYRCCVPDAIPLVPVTKTCSDYTNFDTCKAGGCAWYDKTGMHGCFEFGDDNGCAGLTSSTQTASCETSCSGGTTRTGLCLSSGSFYGKTCCLKTKTSVAPVAPVCTPNCSCAANTLVGQNCSNGCNGTCEGTKVAAPVCTPNCSCAANTLVGQNCSNGCNGTCEGTKVASVTCTDADFNIGSCVAGNTRTVTKKSSSTCNTSYLPSTSCSYTPPATTYNTKLRFEISFSGVKELYETRI